MITFKASQTLIVPMCVVASVMEEHGVTPEVLTLHDGNGNTLKISAEEGGHYTCGGWAQRIQMAWMNRPALDGSCMRWSPEIAYLDEALDDLQDEISIRLDAAEKRAAEQYKQAFVECQVHRYLNGVRDSQSVVAETIPEQEYERIADKYEGFTLSWEMGGD